MKKYQNKTFKSVIEARAYITECMDVYGYVPQVIQITKTIKLNGDSIPKGLIISYLDVTWDDKKNYVISPLYGVGYYVTIPRDCAKKLEVAR